MDKSIVGKILKISGNFLDVNYFGFNRKCWNYFRCTTFYVRFQKKKFIGEFNQIPYNSLSGLHVHKIHQIPSKNDIIPWRFVSNEINFIESEKPYIYFQKFFI